MPVRHELSRQGGLYRITAVAAVMIAFAANPAELQPDHQREHQNALIRPAHPHRSEAASISSTSEKPEHSRQPLTPAQIAVRQVTPEDLAAWGKVAICEEGGDWHVSGSEYSGGLGISNDNWIAYGGQEFTPTAATATPAEQIVIAKRIQPDPPDQNGCEGAW